MGRFFTLGLRSQAPGKEVARVQGDAEQIGGDKSKLRGANADHANDGAIDGGDDPALPQSFAQQDRTEDGQDAGDVIQSKGVEHIQQFA